jgi:hypothetical protein
MTTTSRQNNLILAEDWTRIYQTFKNADFKSYDFENLRRVMITYLRENYPEDFNDYIESSEYVALIDLIAFLGQSLSFRIDLASRENFIELAERKESVLRLARTLAYNPKRNIAAEGLLKFDTISTTETLVDNTGRNLARQVIQWNDPTNPNWFEQFITIINSAMVENIEFGKSQLSDVIDGIQTDQYRINLVESNDVPLYIFSKTVAGRFMTFEIVSTSFKGQNKLYEEAPFPGNKLGLIYKQDGRGNGSPNTGFFLMFKQGSLELADFQIAQPVPNERVAVDSTGINNSDVWVYSLDSQGREAALWTPVNSLIGNNIAYNSTKNNEKNIYSIITKTDDTIDLAFSDGVFGNLPSGPFRTYYRVSNGLRYTISPTDLQGISIAIPYRNAAGIQHTLTVSMSLNYSVSNSTPSEDIDSIRINAPATYYTQNRMITGEDYNLAPLAQSQEILKVKAVNRSSSGISRNFDIIDASGKYSKVNVFADDGLIYRKNTVRTFKDRSTNKSAILNFIKSVIEPNISSSEIYNFYITNFDKIFTSDVNVKWLQLTNDNTISTGNFGNIFDSFPVKIGQYTTSNLKFVEVGSLIKFVPPNANQAFKDGKIVTYDPANLTHQKYIWVKVISVIGDGTNAGRGALTDGSGAVTLSENIPSEAIPLQVVPRFVVNLDPTLETEIVELMFASRTFGIRYDISTRNWKIISGSNIDLNSAFSLGQAGDQSNSNLDSSWIIAFVFDGDEYDVSVRGTDYIFASEEQNRFYFDKSEKIYDSKTRTVIKDQIRVLGINKTPAGKDTSPTEIATQIINLKNINPNFTFSDVLSIVEQDQTLKQDYPFEIFDAVRFEDGYQSAESIKLAFIDSDDDGVIDNPDSFDEIVGINNIMTKYLFFKESFDQFGFKALEFINNDNGIILVRDREVDENINNYLHNQLVYFSDLSEDVIKRVDLISRTFILEPEYVAFVGRSNLKFQYIHNASSDRRIDPSVSNIMDIYLLTRQYDTNYRNWISSGTTAEPVAPNSEQLRTQFSGNLESIKSISDEIIFHPVRYFPLFGKTAAPEFQATIKIVKNPNKIINNNDLKVRIINSISEFFSIENWDFGDKFFASELVTYVVTQNAPDISNMVIVPNQSNQAFGSLLEIQSRSDEIFISSATVDNIEIINNITATELNLLATQIISTTSR